MLLTADTAPDHETGDLRLELVVDGLDDEAARLRLWEELSALLDDSPDSVVRERVALVLRSRV